MNAVHELVRSLPRRLLADLLRRDGEEIDPARETEVLRGDLARRFEGDLAAFLNTAHKAELEQMAQALKIDDAGDVSALRRRLWRRGAVREAGSDQHLGAPWQPEPVVLRSKLVHLVEGEGTAAPADTLPRPIPPAAALSAPPEEPETLETLLGNAQRLVGLRLGSRGRDKGAYGSRVEAYLGVSERGVSEPDWRGEVEIKSVPVARDRGGLWFVVEDPAVAMDGVDPLVKLRRVLWIARVSDDETSPILSWFYQEWSWRLAQLWRRDLHQRPKGAAGATTKGWYLHKRFFADSGLLFTLNGRGARDGHQ